MTEALSEALTYVGVVLVGILLWAALAPFEVLGWWAGWFGDTIHLGTADYAGKPEAKRSANRCTSTERSDLRCTMPRSAAPSVDKGGEHAHLRRQDRPACFIVFLSGIARVSGESFSYREQDFLRRLRIALPQAVILDDIFPYSVNNLPLTGQPLFARLWRFALRSKLSGPGIAGYLINLRNMWQVMISADKRYGPIFNQAIADVIAHCLLRYGYEPERPAPIFVIGYSGAGQVSVGASTYLKEFFQTPVFVISLGGVFASDPGVMAADRVYHIYGARDRVHRYGLFAPGRWSIFPGSAWNRAKREGRVVMLPAGPMQHMGARGYLDAKSHLSDGSSYVDATVEIMRKIVVSELAQVGEVGDKVKG